MINQRTDIKPGQIWEIPDIDDGPLLKPNALVRVEQNNGGLIAVTDPLTGHGSLFGWKTFLERYTPSVVTG